MIHVDTKKLRIKIYKIKLIGACKYHYIQTLYIRFKLGIFFYNRFLEP